MLNNQRFKAENSHRNIRTVSVQVEEVPVLVFLLVLFCLVSEGQVETGWTHAGLGAAAALRLGSGVRFRSRANFRSVILECLRM